MDRLRIPKHRGEVEVTGPDGEMRRFSVFLAERTNHGGPERVCDLLNGSREFLPAMFNPDEMDCLHRLHQAFDPLGISNPGKMFPTAEAPALQEGWCR